MEVYSLTTSKKFPEYFTAKLRSKVRWIASPDQFFPFLKYASSCLASHEKSKKLMKIRRFGKNYMQKILIDRFCEFQKLTQKWKFLTFLASLTYYKAFNGIIFIFLKYSRLLWARWCIFQKNPRQNFFDQNHCISPRYNSYILRSFSWSSTHDLSMTSIL